jgi:TonB family protein
VPFDFQHIDYTGYGNFVRARLLDGRQGIYNFQGREVLKPVYRNLLFYAPALFAAQDFDTGKSGMLDTLGKVVLPLEYAACRVVGREGPFLKARQKEADSWALFGPDGQRLSEPTYLEFEYYQNAPDLIFGQQKDRKWVLLNRQGQVQPEAPFDDYSVHSASFVLRQGDLRAFLNLTGQRVTPYKYTLAKGFTSLKEARQLGKELNVSAPDSLLGSASLNGQQVYVDSRGRELTRSDTAQYERLSDEQQASFPGGESALIKYLESHLRYPPEAAKNSIQGRAVLSFKIEADGSLSEIKVLRDPGGGCGAEAVRLVQSMPKWVPASVGGKAVATRFTLPVTFRLNH